MLNIDTRKESLQEFGKTLTIVLFLLSAFWAHKGHPTVSRYFLYTAFLFSFVSLFIPTTIKYLYLGWMKLANVIATAITTALIFIIYFLFVTPYSLLIRVFKRSILDQKIEKKKHSYWIERDTSTLDLKTYRRQF